MSNPNRFLLVVEGLSVCYYTSRGITKAVDGVSFNVSEGERLGVVGESGSGKSTLAWAIMRSLPIAGKIVGGKICYKGRSILEYDEIALRKIRGNDISMVTQASLDAFDPLKRISDQIVEVIRVHKDVKNDAAFSITEELLQMVGIDRLRGKDYPHTFSGGMRQRAMIAMALACDPSLVILDEPSTALDVISQAKILGLLAKLEEKRNLSVILITHDLSVVADICNTLLVMYCGKIMEYGKLSKLVNRPLHPYTKAIIKAYPVIDEDEMNYESIPGSPPDLTNIPSGCVFSPRCSYVMDVCRIHSPPIIKVEDDRFVACHMFKKQH